MWQIYAQWPTCRASPESHLEAIKPVQHFTFPMLTRRTAQAVAWVCRVLRTENSEPSMYVLFSTCPDRSVYLLGRRTCIHQPSNICTVRPQVLLSGKLVDARLIGEKEMLKHFDNLLLSVRSTDPILAWTVNYALPLNETIRQTPMDSWQADDARRQIYFSMVAALRTPKALGVHSSFPLIWIPEDQLSMWRGTWHLPKQPGHHGPRISRTLRISRLCNSSELLTVGLATPPLQHHTWVDRRPVIRPML